MSIADKIDKQQLPQHVAIIMDGNGRWAKERGLERAIGHQHGVISVQKVTEAATRIGIKYMLFLPKIGIVRKPRLTL